MLSGNTKTNKAQAVFVWLIISLSGVLGCATVSSSTGFIGNKYDRPVLPPGIPERVGVIPFSGNIELGAQSADQFATGLITMGFEVVERQKIMDVLKELHFQNSGLVDPRTREELGRQLGIQGVFVGSITGESSITWVDSHLNLRLVSIETGMVLWAAEAHDPRAFTWSMDARTSAVYTVKNALYLLQKDLDKKGKEAAKKPVKTHSY